MRGIRGVAVVLAVAALAGCRAEPAPSASAPATGAAPARSLPAGTVVLSVEGMT